MIQTLKNNFPFHVKNKKIGIAVSGGADSMVLLDIFCKLKQENNLELYVLHYNHKWRKKSYLDARLVRDYCEKNQIKFLYFETKGEIVKDEELARSQRYRFFKEVAKKYTLDFICTAHHRDDQVETILFRLARGTGPKGLMPIKKHYDLTNKTKIFRPFLEITKDKIYNYAKRNYVPFIEDVTNKDLVYKRNLIRRKVIPLLQKINKEALNNILLCSDLIYAQDYALSKHLSSLLKSLSTNNLLVWNRKKFLQFDTYTQKALLYWFLTLHNVRGNISKIELVLQNIYKKKAVDIGSNFRLWVDESKICFKRQNVNSVAGNSRDLNLAVKQSLILEPFKRKAFIRRFPEDKKKIAYVDLSHFKNKSLAIRYRKAHDIFFPLGFSNPVKLKKYLINKKIPSEKRYNLPLLCCGNEVLWIPGYSLSDKLKVLGKPTHVLKINGQGLES